MSGILFLDWLGLLVSFLNSILLVWLSITVLLNTEKRTIGVYLASEGLLSGAAFFVAHSVILAQGALSLLQNYDFWWHVGWLPAILCPFAWYLVVLWYSGFWDDRRSFLFHRHLPWLIGVSILTFGLITILLLSQPLLAITIINQTNQAVRLGLGLGYIPFLVWFYPLDIVLVICLSLDGLIRPAPSAKVMGDIARRRARPWLIATTILLLMVGLAVGATLFYLQQMLQSPNAVMADLITQLAYPLSIIDVLLACIVTAATLTIGQATASYEIFTGKVFPRRGILGEWYNIIILALVVSAFTSVCIVYQVRLVYTLVTLLFIFTIFYAILSWRGTVERERAMRDLRPFVNSQRLLDLVIGEEESQLGTGNLQAPFDALCKEILNAHQAALIPLGALSALISQPLFFPAGKKLELPQPELLTGFNSPQTMGISLDPEKQHGFSWILPLWNESGLNGVIALGEKNNGGFYSQEEIEIAQAAGERLADILATVELSHRLMVLQRQRLAQSQVLDRQTRRVLHDEVLPRLHTALLNLSTHSPVDNQEIVDSLAQTHRQISSLLRELPLPDAPDVSRYGFIGAIQHLVQNELSQAFDEVVWKIDPMAQERIARLSPITNEVLYYAARETLRNAAHYARPTGTLRPLKCSISLIFKENLQLIIEDNGVGILPYTENGRGSGQGLALHSTMMAVIGGSLTLESSQGEFTRVRLILPATQI